MSNCKHEVTERLSAVDYLTYIWYNAEQVIK